MPSHSISRIISAEPGDYVIHRDAYEAQESFNADMRRVQDFCENYGHYFRAVCEVEQPSCEAFIVGIGRWHNAHQTPSLG